MKEYLLLLRGAMPMTQRTEAELKADMEAWGIYMGALAQSNNLVGGLPLVAEGCTLSASGTIAQPVTSAKEGTVDGYLILRAETLEAATQLAKDCPYIANSGNIEIREIAPMPTV